MTTVTRRQHPQRVAGALFAGGFGRPVRAATSPRSWATVRNAVLNPRPEGRPPRALPDGSTPAPTPTTSGMAASMRDEALPGSESIAFSSRPGSVTNSPGLPSPREASRRSWASSSTTLRRPRRRYRLGRRSRRLASRRPSLALRRLDGAAPAPARLVTSPNSHPATNTEDHLKAHHSVGQPWRGS